MNIKINTARKEPTGEIILKTSDIEIKTVSLSLEKVEIYGAETAFIYSLIKTIAATQEGRVIFNIPPESIDALNIGRGRFYFCINEIINAIPPEYNDIKKIKYAGKIYYLVKK